jgi:hypothetical protein
MNKEPGGSEGQDSLRNVAVGIISGLITFFVPAATHNIKGSPRTFILLLSGLFSGALIGTLQVRTWIKATLLLGVAIVGAASLSLVSPSRLVPSSHPSPSTSGSPPSPIGFPSSPLTTATSQKSLTTASTPTGPAVALKYLEDLTPVGKDLYCDCYHTGSIQVRGSLMTHAVYFPVAINRANVVSFALDQTYQHFQARVGIADEARAAQVRFEVFGAGTQPLVDETVNKGELKPIDANISGVSSLQLVVIVIQMDASVAVESVFGEAHLQ